MNYHGTPGPDSDSRPLPDGWISQFDSNHGRTFWVDTKASPPRSIWTHPLDDPEYQRATGTGASGGFAPPPGPPPSAYGASPAPMSSHTSGYGGGGGYGTDTKSAAVASGQRYPDSAGYGYSQPAHSPAPTGPQQMNSYGQPQQQAKSSGMGGILGKLKSKLDEKKAQQQQPRPYGHSGQSMGYGGQPMYGQQQSYGRSRMGGGGMNPALMLGGGLLGGALIGGAIADGQNDAYQEGFEDGGGDGGDFGGDF